MAHVIDRPSSGGERQVVPVQHWGMVNGAVAREVVRRALQKLREHLAAALKYATNHIIAHVPLAALRHAWYRHALGWRIARGARVQLGVRWIGSGLRTGRGMVLVGADSVIEEGCVLQSLGAIRIGARVRIGHRASLLTGAHDIEDARFALVTRPIVIESDVHIGPKAMVLGDVTVGAGAVIAAGAVVTKDVSPGTIVVGVPAHVTGKRTLEDAV